MRAPGLQPNLSRRQALVGSVLTFGALWGALSVPSTATAQGLLPWTPRALTLEQARILDIVAELIIPATDVPGAREAGVPQFVDRTLAIYSTPADAQTLRNGLDRLEADARDAHGAGFTAISQDQQTALLARHDPTTRPTPRAAVGIARGDSETGLSDRNPEPPQAAAFFILLRELVTVGYFTSELGATKAVRYDPVPGEYRGCVPLKEIGRAWAI